MINILILNWNSSRSASKLIKSIGSSSYKAYRIVLIDNYSKESDRKSIVKIYEDYKDICDIHLILNNENYGYSGGNNIGYDYLVSNNLEGELIILNPDVEISSNTFQVMFDALKSNVGGVMARTVHMNDTRIMYDYIKLKGFMQKYVTSNNKICQTDYLAGSCMLINRALIDKIGLFDVSFFMYWEDVELSLRIKRSGFKLISTTETSIYRSENDQNRSFNAIYYSSKNAFILFAKHNYFSLFDLIYYEIYLFLVCLKIAIKHKKIQVFSSFYSGVLSGIKSDIK